MGRTLRSKSATEYHNLGQHHVYKRVTYQSPLVQGTTGKFPIGGIPAFAMPEDVIVRVRTASTAASDLVIGTSSDRDLYATSSDIDSQTTGQYVTDRPSGGYSTSDISLFASITSTAATAGSFDVWVTFREAEPSTD